MTKLQLGLGVIVVAGFAVIWTMQQQTQAELRKELDAAREKQSQMEELRAENEQLSQQVAQAGSGSSREQLNELLRLRGEVTMLRRQTNELQSLRAQNEQLRQRAVAREAAATVPAKTPPEVSPQDIFPRESWAYVGYNTPEGTVQSLLWAMTQTNREVFLAGFSGEMLAEMEKHFSEKDFAAEMSRESGKFTGFRVVNREIRSADEMVLTLYMEGTDQEDKTTFRRINGQWKIHEPNGAAVKR